MTEAKNKTIIVVDDEPDVAKVLEQLFIDDGFTVKVFENGKKALEEINKERPDLVVTDILMPMLNGLKLCEAIKSDHKTAKIPVILLTAVYREEHHVEMGFQHGADAYFSKPFNPARVLEVAKQLLDQVTPD